MSASRSISMLVMLAILFVAVNLFSNTVFRAARVDLTQGHLFTLAAGTEKLLAKIDEPVTLKFFYSEKLANDYPQVRLYASRVRDLLEEIRDRSNGKIILEVVEPEPFSDEEDVAISYGLKAARTTEDQNIYFGLVGTNLADGLELIPYFADERQPYLEYDVARLIQTLSQTKKPVLGLVTNLPLDTGPGGLASAMQGKAQPFAIYEELQKRFQIEVLEQKFSRVPADVDVLMLAHPKPFEPATLYAIDQFVMGGGRLIAFVDPYSEVSHVRGSDGQPLQGSTESSDLGPLLHDWGVDFNPRQMVGDRELAMRVATGGDTGPSQSDYVLWLNVPKKYLNADDIVTASLDHVNVGTAGALTRAIGATTQFKPLIRSSEDSRLYDTSIVSSAPLPEELLRDFEASGKSKVIAARITGPVTSIFEASEESTQPHLSRSKRDADIIVVADSDIFDDKFWLRRGAEGDTATPIADNANFILSSIDNLAQSDDLISLRARGRIDRPFTRVIELRREAEQRFLAEQQRLQGVIATTEERLNTLQTQGDSDAATKRSIAQFRAELLKSRKALRDVQRNLQRNIDNLAARLRFLNIAAVPIFLTALTLGMGILRHRQRRNSRRLRQ